MPLTVTRCASTSALTISGTVAGQRIRRRASSDDLRLAREEAAALEVEILRTQWRGERRGARTFADAVTSYLEAAPRSESTKARVRRLYTGDRDDHTGRDRPRDHCAAQDCRAAARRLTGHCISGHHRSSPGDLEARPSTRMV